MGPANAVPSLGTGTYVFQAKTKLLVKFAEQVNLVPVGGKIVFMSEGGITTVPVNSSMVTMSANAITIRPDIVNQDASTSWVVIIPDGVIKDTITGAKSAGVYLESPAYHVNSDGTEFLFQTTFRVCSAC